MDKNLEGWKPIDTAERPDEDADAVMVLDGQGRRFLAEWDGAAGQWQGLYALDGVERKEFFQEWPGRIYNVLAWSPIPRRAEKEGQ